MSNNAKRAKAEQNYAAAEQLLESSFLNSCASRAYYAVYFAAWAELHAFGVQPNSSQGDYFRHDSLPDTLFDQGLIEPDEISELELLYAHRIKADYFNDQVEMAEAVQALEIAQNLMTTIGNAAGGQ